MRIGDKGAHCLCKALASNNSLQELHLVSSSFGDFSGVFFFFAATYGVQEWCDIENAGAHHLGNLLKTNSTLRILNLVRKDLGFLFSAGLGSGKELFLWVACCNARALESQQNWRLGS